MKNNASVLLVEDNQVDVMTVQRAFKQTHLTNPLIVATNGEEALAYVERQGHHAEDDDWSKPCLIMLDLNMPIMSGIEFLRIIKSRDLLKRIPVIVLTTSKEDNDRIDSFDLSVAGYIIKPVEFDKFIHVVKVINLYWTLSELPS